MGYNWEKQSAQIPAVRDRNKILKNKLAFKAKPKFWDFSNAS